MRGASRGGILQRCLMKRGLRFAALAAALVMIALGRGECKSVQAAINGRVWDLVEDSVYWSSQGIGKAESVKPSTSTSVWYTKNGQYKVKLVFNGKKATLKKLTYAGTKKIENCKITLPREFRCKYNGGSGTYTLSSIGTSFKKYSSSMFSKLRLTLPDTVSSISDSAFQSCKCLERIAFKNSRVVLGDSSFWGCSSLEKVSSTGDIVLGEYCFYGCKSLSSFDFKKVSEVPEGAFYSCTSLVFSEVPERVKSIGVAAFYGCKSLDHVIVHANAVGVGAFGSCSSLRYVFLTNASAEESIVYNLKKKNKYNTTVLDEPAQVRVKVAGYRNDLEGYLTHAAVVEVYSAVDLYSVKVTRDGEKVKTTSIVRDGYQAFKFTVKGKGQFIVTATDMLGNKSSTSFSVIAGSTKPTIKLTNAGNGIWTNKTVTVKVSDTIAGLKWVLINDANVAVKDDAVTKKYSAEGWYTVEAMNSINKSRVVEFGIDKKKPKLKLSDTRLTITDADSGISYVAINGVSVGDYGVYDLEYGVTYSVVAEDVAGNRLVKYVTP